jgi:25S rRNA (uracil2634-N3)-methyltransferase
MFGVEASALAEAIRRRPGFSPDAVVFNFPHTGSGIKDRARNIVGNQQLLHKFFRSSSEALGAGGAAEKASFTSTRAAYRPVAGHASVDGCAGSEDEDDGAKGPAVVASVVPYVLVTMWQGDPYDSWDLKAIARTYSFRCSHAFEFDFTSYPGYAHCRTDGVKDIGVGKKQRAVTYVFVKATAIVD